MTVSGPLDGVRVVAEDCVGEADPLRSTAYGVARLWSTPV